MDDQMFSEIGLGLGAGPSATVMKEPMISEPAQVMVMVPGGRAIRAETSLQSLQTLIALFFIILFLVAGIYVYFFVWKTRPKYEGRALPAIGEPLQEVPVAEILKPAIQEIREDIVAANPPYPLFEDSDDDVEKKVADTDDDIVKKMKAREAFMKEIEKEHVDQRHKL